MPHGRKESRVMIRSAKALLLAVSLGCLMFGQTPAETPKPDNKAGAYYNFAMGRVYAELAQAYGNKPDYLTKAIEHYQEALKLDPGASLVFEELTDLPALPFPEGFHLTPGRKDTGKRTEARRTPPPPRSIRQRRGGDPILAILRHPPLRPRRLLRIPRLRNGRRLGCIRLHRMRGQSGLEQIESR